MKRTSITMQGDVKCSEFDFQTNHGQTKGLKRHCVFFSSCEVLTAATPILLD